MPRHPPCALSCLISNLWCVSHQFRCGFLTASSDPSIVKERRKVSANGKGHAVRATRRTFARPELPAGYSLLQKGGDPAAGSPTATLLRLRPNRQSHLRQLPPQRVVPLASGVTDIRDLTGGVYKARERIHRDNADSRLLAIPTSRSRVADSDPD
jgi:hypothetical protein